MNGRLGDEDRKNVIISEGKNEERCYPKIYAKECISMKRGRNACEKIRETRLGKDGRKKIGSKQTRNKISNKIVTSVI